MRYMQGYVDRGYVRFLDIVGQGRGLTRDQVNEIAQGRVWLATDALRISLVDQLGSLNDAVKKAAELANLAEYHTKDYPAQTSWIETLFDNEKRTDSYLDSQLKQVLGEFYEPIMQLRHDQVRNRLQARLPFSVEIK